MSYPAFAVTLMLCTACAGGGASLRALSSEPADTPQAEPEPDATEGAAPRIGAPGGRGAGSRSVWPAQSGNEAVGGLLAGKGKSGRRG
jgi:hypothetical protein